MPEGFGSELIKSAEYVRRPSEASGPIQGKDYCGVVVNTEKNNRYFICNPGPSGKTTVT